MDGEEIRWCGVLQKFLLWMGARQRYSWWMVGDTSGKGITRLGGGQESSGGMDTEESHRECKLQLQEEGKGVEEVRQGVQ